MGGLVLLVVVAAIFSVLLTGGRAAPVLSGRSAAVTRVCVGRRAPARYAHVLWIFMENKSFANVIGQLKEAPFENALANGCGVALNYHGISHPSLPNYIGATSGETWGISDDADPTQHPLTVPSIYSQLDRAGLSWREYADGKPGGCPRTNAGRYAVRHDPVTYYTRIRAECARRDSPLGRLAVDLAHNSLPSFALLSPNLCHDTHDCPVETGDHWLSSWLGRILASRTFHEQATAVFLTWDEGGGSNQVPLIVIASSVHRGATSRRELNHYSLLKTTEELLGLAPLGHARDPSTASLVRPFHLLAP
jgi:phosphatidylinositol-3-phosphatase